MVKRSDQSPPFYNQYPHPRCHGNCTIYFISRIALLLSKKYVILCLIYLKNWRGKVKTMRGFAGPLGVGGRGRRGTRKKSSRCSVLPSPLSLSSLWVTDDAQRSAELMKISASQCTPHLVGKSLELNSTRARSSNLLVIGDLH